MQEKAKLVKKQDGTILPKQATMYITELFQLICGQEDREVRKQLLYEYAKKDELHAKLLRQVCELMYHPGIIWELPEGKPPFTPAAVFEGQAPNSLFKITREVSRFLRGGGGFINNPLKRETYFIQLLESMTEQEANLLVAIKDNTVTSIYPYVRIDLFVEVFPNWIPAEVTKDVVPFMEVVEQNTIVTATHQNLGIEETYLPLLEDGFRDYLLSEVERLKVEYEEFIGKSETPTKPRQKRKQNTPSGELSNATL